MRIEETKKILLARRDAIREWLAREAPYTVADQNHLEAHTPEQAYWHHGYEQALADVLDILSESDGPLDSGGKSNSSRQGG